MVHAAPALARDPPPRGLTCGGPLAACGRVARLPDVSDGAVRLTPVEADRLAAQLSRLDGCDMPRRSSPSSRRSVVSSGPRESNGRDAGESSC